MHSSLWGDAPVAELICPLCALHWGLQQQEANSAWTQLWCDLYNFREVQGGEAFHSSPVVQAGFLFTSLSSDILPALLWNELSD